MMQKTLVKLHIRGDKCRTKAFKISASTPGVIRVSILGADRDHLEVIGNEVDPVCLTKALRKKLGFAKIIKVEQVVESRGCFSEQLERPTPIQYCPTTSSYGDHCQHPQICYPNNPMYYHEQPTHDNCSIM